MTREEKKPFYKLIFPSMIEIIFSQLFSLVDNMMVGHIENSTVSVAALSLCGAPINLVVCVTSAFFIGTTAAVARNFGAGKKREVKDITSQTMILSTLIALVLSTVVYVFAGNIMGFICKGQEVYEIATMYYRINAIGFFFQIIAMNITASFRGIGITKIPMIYNLVGNALNVVLNYILIYGKFGFPVMEARGAAIATVVSKAVIFLIAIFILICKKSDIRPDRKVNLKNLDAMKHMVIPIGLTSGAEQLILQSGATVTAKIVAILPTSDIAACQIVSNVESLAWSTGDACCTASTSLFGRYLGEKRPDKSKRFLSLTAKWAMGFAAFEIVLFFLCGKPIARLFSNDASLYDLVKQLLIIGSISLPFINMHKTISGALRSAGDSLAPLISSLISLWIFRVVLGYILVILLGKGVVAYKWCINIDQIVRMTSMLIFFLSGHWKKFCGLKDNN